MGQSVVLEVIKKTRTRRSKLGRLSLAARRLKNIRKRETPEERAARLEKNKLASAQKRANETPEERDERLSRGRRSVAKRRRQQQGAAAREHREAVLAKIKERKHEECFEFLDTMASEAVEVQADPSALAVDVNNAGTDSNSLISEATSNEEAV